MKSIYWVLALLLVLMIAITGCERYNPFEAETEVEMEAVGKAAGPARWIVVLEPGTFANEPALEGLLKRFDAVEIKRLELVNGVAVHLPPEAVGRMEVTAGVVRVEPDIVFQINPKPDKPGKPPKDDPKPQSPEELPWGVDRIDADLAWGNSTGSGVSVGIIDTGIDLGHPDLTVVGDYNAINPRKSGKDDNGHGTHVAGIVAALDNNIGVIGVSPQADIYAVKAFDRRGSGFVSDIIDGIEWCMDPLHKMDVINMSFGSTSSSPSLSEAITLAAGAGITMVVSAGNEDGGAVTYPAKYPETIAVSAIDDQDQFASFSSKGEEVDLAAPGVKINSTYKGGEYKVFSGTSMAAPHVTGTVALVLANGNIPDLQGTAEVLLGLSQIEQGAGLVDAEEAVK